MIYSPKTNNCNRNLSREEKVKLKKLRATKPTAWMIDTKSAVN